MKKYNEFKDSGIEWIGEIPKNWMVKRFDSIFDFSRGLPITKQDLRSQGIPCVNYGEIHSKYGFKVVPEIHNLKYVDEEFLLTNDKSLLSRGDIVFADTSEDIDGSGNFAYLDSDIPTFAGYHTIIARNRTENYYGFLAYFLDSIEFRNQIRSNVSGIKVYSITQSILKYSKFLIPSVEEQIQIANYLDTKTAEIDNIIAAKKKLIQLYEEEKATIVNLAVTKGINPDVKLKPSGVEWLGDVPEHWEVKPLKYLIEGKLKYGANESAEEENYKDPRYIRITDFGNNGDLRHDTFKSLSIEKAQEYMLKEGDILFARSGATVGKTFQFKNHEGQACFAGYLIRATPNNELITSDFIYYFTKSPNYDSWKNSVFSQATIQNIGADKYAFIQIGFPSIEEQIEINQFISNKIRSKNKKIEKAKKLVELLTEYRTTLISEVVTGKLKVTR